MVANIGLRFTPRKISRLDPLNPSARVAL